MPFYADLHLHSRFSRATSRDCDLFHLSVWARRKGLGLIGTGDFTHPGWMAELREQLVPAEPGLFRLRPDLERRAAAEAAVTGASPTRFVLSVEVSTIYRKGERTRKVHHLIYAPDLAVAGRISAALGAFGKLAADGRPTLKLDSRDLLELVLASGPDPFLIPAHIWTPWFSALGSRSGFDAIDDCYGDLSRHVFAAETGLSSDPPMNWRVSSLDRLRLISSSDAHSPRKLGREATRFTGPLSFEGIRRALETGHGYGGTVEMFPEEGKYHHDGHRRCGVRLAPEESRRAGGRCPACGAGLTLGVLHRVEALADRGPGAPPPPTAGAYHRLVPLPELLGEMAGVGPATRTVARLHADALARLGPEIPLLQEVPLDEVRRRGSTLVARALTRLRSGDVHRQPGYDGVFGTIRVLGPKPSAPRRRPETILPPVPGELP